MHKVLGFKSGNLYLVIQDVQPASNLDALLLSMRQRMGALFDNLPIALLIAAPSGKVEAINRVAQKMFEYEPHESRSLNIADLFGSSESSMTPDLLVNRVRHFPRLTVSTASGDQLVTEVHAQQLPDDKLLISIFDISQKVELEEFRRSFAGIIRHDIRTPMTSINLFLHTVVRGLYRNRTMEQLEVKAGEIEKEAARAMELVSRLLELDALGHETTQPPNPQNFSLRKTFDASLNVVASTLKRRSIGVSCEFDDQTVFADVEQIYGVLANVFRALIEYESLRHIEIDARQELDRVAISISVDNSSAAQLVPQQHDSCSEGSLVGAQPNPALVSIIEANGGQIVFSSCPNASCTIVLPRGEVENS